METNKDLVRFINSMPKVSQSDKGAMIERVNNGDGNLKVVLSAMMRRIN